jgi:hypothetical protein
MPASSQILQILYRTQITAIPSIAVDQWGLTDLLFIKLVIITSLQILVKRLDFSDVARQPWG